jgi:hypothetical protein
MAAEAGPRQACDVPKSRSSLARPGPIARISAAGAPVLLFLYGVLRLVDGLDGGHGPGAAWDAGHVLFFLAFVLLAALIVEMARLVPSRSAWHRIPAALAAVVGVAGALCFLWVILGDLSRRLHDSAPLPGPLHDAGPLLFELGLMTLLVQLAAIRPRRLPVLSPILVFLGFVPIAADLDLLPLGAILILCGLFPFNRRPARPRRKDGEVLETVHS